MSTIGTYIKELRNRKGLSINDLVALTGISKGYISQIENDKFNPSPEILEKLASALNVSHLQLLEKAGHIKETRSGMNELIKHIEQWSYDRELHNAEPAKQFIKVVEEVGEIARSLARQDDDLLRDAIGDVVVTLIILAQQHNMTLEECLGFAYDEIKDRKGQMVDGVFVKEADLIQGDK